MPGLQGGWLGRRVPWATLLTNDCRAKSDENIIPVCSPSSPPTLFILCSHHTNSYGHKMERVRMRAVAGRSSGSLLLTPAACSPPMSLIDIILLVLLSSFYCPSHPQMSNPVTTLLTTKHPGSSPWLLKIVFMA